MMATTLIADKSMIPSIYLKDIAQILLCLLDKKAGGEHVTWISPASLQQHNVITSFFMDNLALKKESMLIRNEDILIKRVNPSFVNYINDINEDVYAHNNLFIVRVHEGFCPKYVAFILNEIISRHFAERSRKSDALIAMTFKELQSMPIPLLALDEQERVGNAWFYAVEKLKLSKKLAELEFTKGLLLLKKYMLGDA